MPITSASCILHPYDRCENTLRTRLVFWLRELVFRLRSGGRRHRARGLELRASVVSRLQAGWWGSTPDAAWAFDRSPATTRDVIFVGRDHGLASADLLDGLGFTLEDLVGGRRVEPYEEVEVVRNLLAGCPSARGLGVECGLRFTIEDLGMLAAAFRTSSTLREAIDIGLAMRPLTFAWVVPSLEISRGRGEVVFDAQHVPHDVRLFMLERDVTMFCVTLIDLIGDEVQTLVRGPFEPETVAKLSAALPTTRFELGTECFVSFDASVLGSPPGAPQLPDARLDLPRTLAAELERRRAPRPPAQRVQDVVFADPAKPPSFSELASWLNFDVRTLRRKLASDGLSYRTLIAKARVRRARRLLKAGSNTVEEIAAKVGYSDAAGFSNAYKRWLGVRPGLERPGRQKVAGSSVSSASSAGSPRGTAGPAVP